MSSTSDTLVQLAWTQLWQVTLLTLLVAVVVRLACQRRPHLAYLLWLVVLVKCLTPPLWSSPTGVFSWTQRAPAASSSQIALQPVATKTTAAVAPLEKRPGLPADPSVADFEAATTTMQPAPQPTLPGAPSHSAFPSLASMVLAVWLLGMAGYSTWAALALLRCSRQIARRSVSHEQRLAELLTCLAQRLGVRRPVRLAIVDGPIGPLTCGWLRPTIAIPLELVRKSEIAMEPILAHELVHVRRGDAFVGILQVASQSIWWFHPLIWYMNRSIGAERERCCDEEVVASLSYEPIQYGRSLLEVLALKRRQRLPAVVPGIRPFEITRRRLQHLVSHSKSFRPRMPRVYWGALAIALLLVLPGAGLIRSEQIAAAKSPPKSDTWTVAGQVVDHRGEPVANAEVILLGEERIVVEADRRTWFVSNAANDPSAKPQSVRTDRGGRFEIERSGKDANRLAVIATDPVFWVVKREQIADPGKALIKLPAPGSIAVELDLPGKPAKQEINIGLRTLDGKDWEPDLLRYHLSTNTADNPGTTVFGHLPPGKYSVERNQATMTDKNVSLITFADRQLSTVEPGKQTTVRIDRKQGRLLSGRVTGLTGRDLRHAHLSINYFGPEEHPGKDGKPVRFMTAFDVIPITPSGEFTTDPIPPGEYLLLLSAKLASSPNQIGEADDFQGQMNVTVPAEGEMPQVELRAKRRRKATSVSSRKSDKPALEVVDEAGQPVPAFEIKVWSTDRGNSMWYNGSRGRIPQNTPLWGFAESGAVQLTVRADGFASKIVQFAGTEREALLAGKAKIVLERGREVQLRFNLPDGMTWPAAYLPDIYFQELFAEVRVLWQPENRQNYEQSGLPDFNMLNARLVSPGVVSLRVAESTAPFKVAIYAPDFLRFFVRGPFTLQSFANSELAIDVDRPATLRAHFDAGEFSTDDLPFEKVNYSAIWMIPGTGNLALSVNDSRDASSEDFEVRDLAPGDYRLTARTVPKPSIQNLSTDPTQPPLNPGAFFGIQNVSLKGGATEAVDFKYVPFNQEAWRGANSAALRFLKTDGTPAADREVKVLFFDGHYGNLPVYSGKIPSSGELKLDGLSAQKFDLMPQGPYSVYLGTQRAGTFGLDDKTASQPVTFHLPPDVGDIAPDVSLLNLKTGETVHLESFRGKVVCLEFWASWCGPCRQPLEKLNKLVGEKQASWQDQVAIVTVSIDEQPEGATRHLQGAGLDHLPPYWTGSKGDAGWEAPAAKLFGVSGVPTALLIDRDGRVLWRGHPLGRPGEMDLEARIDAALDP